jgi:hypothetical protein
MSIKELKKEIKGIFKLPKKSYYFGKVRHGAPYFYPRNYNNTIISIAKEKKRFDRCKSFNLFNRCISYGSPIKIIKNDLGWKDKYNSPRFEWTPAFHLYFFNLQFCIYYMSPDNDNDLYYEMILWYLEYSDKNIKKAEETWSWTNYETKKSTWNNDYIINTIVERRKRKLKNLKND